MCFNENRIAPIVHTNREWCKVGVMLYQTPGHRVDGVNRFFVFMMLKE